MPTTFELNLQNFATRLSTEFKALRTLINGNQVDLSSLNTTAKNNLVAALNEVFGITATLQTAVSGKQPLDADLTAIAALTTTSFGRGLLTVAAGDGLAALVAAGTTDAAGVLELATTAETVTGTDTQRAVSPAGVSAAINALVGGAPGLLDTLKEIADALGDDPNFSATMTSALAGKQPFDADLTAIAALASAANKVPYATGTNTWALADFTAFGRSIVAAADAAAARTTLDVYSKGELGDPTTDYVAIFEAGLV